MACETSGVVSQVTGHRSLVAIHLLLAELVDYEARAQLGFKPSGLRRHNVAGVGDVDDLLHRDGIEGEGDLHLAVVDATFQLAQTADTAHEVDTLVGAQVLDAQNLVEDEVGEITVNDREFLLISVNYFAG